MINNNQDFDAEGTAGAESPSDPLNDSLTNHQEKLPKMLSKIPRISAPRGSFRQFRNSNIFLKKHRIENECVPSFLTYNRDSTLTSTESHTRDFNTRSFRFSLIQETQTMDISLRHDSDDQHLHEFIQTTSFQDRIKIIKESLQNLQSHLFGDKDEFKLLMSEVTKNGMRDRYFSELETRDDLLDQLNRTKKKFNSEKKHIQFTNAEILSLLLFTHSDQELYRDLRKSMTEKLFVDSQIPKGNEQVFNRNKDLGYRNYLLWKKKYEKEARRKYKWPILQIFLQIAVAKLILRDRDPNQNMVQYSLQFLKVSSSEDESANESANENEDQVFEFADLVDRNQTQELKFMPPYLTPFTHSETTSKIKAMKIFGIVKLELLKVVEPSTLKKQTKISSIKGKLATARKTKKDQLGDGSETTCTPNGSQCPNQLYKELCEQQSRNKKQYSSRLSLKLKNKLLKRVKNNRELEQQNSYHIPDAL